MADSSKDIQLRELKDMINDLKKMIKTLQANTSIFDIPLSFVIPRNLKLNSLFQCKLS